MLCRTIYNQGSLTTKNRSKNQSQNHKEAPFIFFAQDLKMKSEHSNLFSNKSKVPPRNCTYIMYWMPFFKKKMICSFEGPKFGIENFLILSPARYIQKSFEYFFYYCELRKSSKTYSLNSIPENSFPFTSTFISLILFIFF